MAFRPAHNTSALCGALGCWLLYLSMLDETFLFRGPRHPGNSGDTSCTHLASFPRMSNRFCPAEYFFISRWLTLGACSLSHLPRAPSSLCRLYSINIPQLVSLNRQIFHDLYTANRS
ncbi:hypothetical protein BXZ70DRAFT_709935 [Cristinia sonorae]|uniref:Uncharacterized protein n=1 Tax=Cristinia sonorae TaxID=1940300 RepID=A0A8K0XJK9_9AGAR|nr:hypothetical protein BXZ70DRAFT_709935 [Cristinia sonorae]